MLFEFKYYPKLPFSDKDWDTLGEIAQKYLTEIKIPKKVKDTMDPLVWAAEANEIASTFIYEGIKENEEVP